MIHSGGTISSPYSYYSKWMKTMSPYVSVLGVGQLILTCIIISIKTDFFFKDINGSFIQESSA